MAERQAGVDYRGLTWALLRIMAGLMLTQHGIQKHFGLLQQPNPPRPWEGPPAFLSQDWIAGTLELVGGLLVTIGLFTRPVAFVLAGLMAAAYFMVHSKWLAGSFFPIVNRGELAALYCFVYLFLAANGAGPLSVDRARLRRRAVPLGEPERGV